MQQDNLIRLLRAYLEAVHSPDKVPWCEAKALECQLWQWLEHQERTGANGSSQRCVVTLRGGGRDEGT